MASSRDHLYRRIPGVNEVLESAEFAPLLQAYNREVITEATRSVLGSLRAKVRLGVLDDEGVQSATARLAPVVEEHLRDRLRPRLRRVVNATGVILQTNLGRAPLSDDALQAIVEVARGYSNLEFDLASGTRGRRDVHVEPMLLELLALPADIYGAAVVNNCAAATFLALNTLAEGGEVVVSRGELVEIGGGFRIPEILAKSGAVLREVGTTNKTRIADYATAIGPQTKLLMRVHRSNFSIEGFTEQPTLDALVALGAQASIPVFDDQGTGCLVELDQFGLRGQASLPGSLRSGVSLIAASGDKLLGGPQSGLLIGKRDLIERIRANPLYRALRVDKLTYAALGATLSAYLSGDLDRVPVLRMMRLSADSVRQRCERIAEKLRSDRVSVEVTETRSVVGGGTTPGTSLPSYALALRLTGQAEAELAASLRRLEPPVIGRVSDGRVLLDLRTVPESDDEALLALLQAAVTNS